MGRLADSAQKIPVMPAKAGIHDRRVKNNPHLVPPAVDVSLRKHDGKRCDKTDSCKASLIDVLKFLIITAIILPLAACSASDQNGPLLSAVPADSGVYSKNTYQGPQADYILVLKSQRRLILYRNRQPLKEYSIGIGWDPLGPKTAQGDGKTPEGLYSIDYRKADSQYHMALHISYPNQADKLRATSIGYNPGGGIMIHGIAAEHAYMGRYDRTEGCIAVTNPDIEEIWNLVPDHTSVEIRA